jgi:hypothetical protein
LWGENLEARIQTQKKKEKKKRRFRGRVATTSTHHAS